MAEYRERTGEDVALLTTVGGRSRLRLLGSEPFRGLLLPLLPPLADRLKAASDSRQDWQPDAPRPRLPRLTQDGFPAALGEMSQASLRSLIPQLLRLTTGRAKPAWGKPEARPPWWPHRLPFANVRTDFRPPSRHKDTVGWTQVLRSIVRACYQYYGQEILLELPSKATLDLDQSQPPPRGPL